MLNYYEQNYRVFLPADRNAKILDIGCGKGVLVHYLHGLGYRSITAVDVDRDALTQIGDLDGVTLVEADVDADFVRAMPDRFALIVMKQMIYYLDRGAVRSFLHAVRDRLDDDGRIIVEIFNGSMISGRFTEIKDPGIRTAYSEHSLRRLLEQSGFSVTEMFGFRAANNSLKSRIYNLAQQVWFGAYRLLLILERGKDDELPRIRQKTIIAIAGKRR